MDDKLIIDLKNAKIVFQLIQSFKQKLETLLLQSIFPLLKHNICKSSEKINGSKMFYTVQ